MSYPILKPNSTWFSPNVTTIKRSTITTINIVDTYIPSDTFVDSWDASVTQDNSIICYVEGTTLTIAGNGSGGIFANADSGFVFSDIAAKDYFTKLTTINGLNLLDTTDATDMQGMFRKSGALISVNVSNWNTSKVQSFRGTFRECTSLTTVDVSGWDTGNATDMYTMFYSCKALVELGVDNWNVSNVTNMSYMFSTCSKLESLNIKDWNVSNVTDMSYLFASCDKLTELDLSAKPETNAWNVSNVTNMSYMFNKCMGLESVNMKGWNTSSLTTIKSMFYLCIALREIDVSDFDTQNITDMSFVFSYCYGLENIIGLENWDTSNVTTMSQMFRTNSGYGPPNTNDIRVLDLSSFNTSKVTDMGAMFENCPFLETIYFGDGWDTSNVENMSYMFNQCSALIELDLSKWDTTNTTNMTSMFRKCNSLQKVTLGDKFSFKGNGGAYCTLPNPSSDYIDEADGYWYALDGTAFAPENIPSLKAAIYYASKTLVEESIINIHFNDERYIIEKALLASAIEDLDIHFSTVINGDGAIINFMGAEYTIDAEKLSTTTDALVLHIETLAGSGKKVNIGGIDYGIDSTKVARTFEDLENLFKDLSLSNDN